MPRASCNWRAAALRLGRRGTAQRVVGDVFEGLAGLDEETARLLAAQYLEQLRALAPAAWRTLAALRIVDKMPHNYLYLGLLACLFPRARFIHCRRDVRDVAVSCWMTHFKAIRWTNDPRHIAAQFRRYRRIMEHWRNVLPCALLGGGLRRDGGRSGRRRAAAGRLVLPGMGAGLLGVSSRPARCPHGQRRPGPPAGLRDVGGQMEELRQTAGGTI